MAGFDRNKIREALNGISGILVTPYDSKGEIAPDRLSPIVDRAIDAGVHVLVANGNTSEYYSLRQKESEAMVAAVTKVVKDRVPVLGGVGRGIYDACDLARASADAGVDALMIHQPPDPFVAPRGILAYVEAIARVAPNVPLVLYLRNENIGIKTIVELCQISQVVGVKWASPTPVLLAEAIRKTRDCDIAWVGGLAETWAPAFYAAGARGFTSGLINVFPEKSVDIHNALEGADYETARSLIETVLPFEELRSQENNGTNVTVVKAALQLMGNDCGATRPPSAWPMTEPSLETLKKLVETLKA